MRADVRRALVAAAYRFDLDEAQQLDHMIATVARTGGLRGPMLAATTRLESRAAVRYGAIAGLHGDPRRGVLDAFRKPPPTDLRRMLLTPPSFTSLSELFGVGLRGAAASFGISEFVGLHCPTGDGAAIVLGTIQAEPHRVSHAELRYWRPVARHLAAGLRLRHAARETAAVLSSDGKIAHVAPEAQHMNDREALREVVRARERARTRRRSAGDSFWPVLVRGRWTIVDRFDSDGRRYVVACRNPHLAATLEPLRPRDHLILDAVARGESNKAIAIDLGVSEATVSRALVASLARLGLAPSDLPLTGAKARQIELVRGHVEIASFARSLEGFTRLSAAECEVIRAVLAGHTNAEIARRRGRAIRTIANQLATAYRKLGVCSRRELLASLVRRD